MSMLSSCDNFVYFKNSSLHYLKANKFKVIHNKILLKSVNVFIYANSTETVPLFHDFNIVLDYFYYYGYLAIFTVKTMLS
jgi:hypothetical protein